MSVKRMYKFIFAGAIALAILLIFAIPALAKANTNSEVKRAVPFSEVNVDEGFMHDYMKLVICEVIPTAIKNVESYDVEKDQCGGMYNIRNCAIWHRGGEWTKHLGALYVDSDVHKVLESMCMALDTPSGGDAEIEAAQNYIYGVLQDWIPYYQDAPEKEGDYAGYFDSFWSLDPDHVKYSNTDQHELYCQGHFIEAAVAHYRYSKHHDAVPDKRLLDVAVASADHITKTFGNGPGQRKQIPGHEEIELALMKLAKLCQEIGDDYYAPKAEGYINTAAFFLSVRGDYENRTVDDTQNKREYYQDHALVENQTEGVGHAVRAQYLYTGMCELATIRPEYFSKYKCALNALWENVTHQKQYITGGIGDRSNNNEGFAGNYFLPNYLSYCETCAGVANMLWNRSMSTLFDGSEYADQIETDLYNNILGCINFDGDKFYYENRICTNGAFDRSSWFGTACCPPNYTRTILQVGGYIYNTTPNAIYVNQYVSNTAKFSFGANNVGVTMRSNFPYTANGSINIKPDSTGNFDVYLRMPSWSNNYSIKVGGQEITPTVKDGYLVISGQTWSSAGTTIEFNFDMPLIYEKTAPQIETNQGLIALRHGPILYCSEGCDNDVNFSYEKALIDQNGAYNFEYVDSLDGKANPYNVRSVYVLNHAGKLINGDGISDITWRLVPYYARCNRTLMSMRLFFHDGQEPIKTHQRATASASFTCVRDSANWLNDATNDDEMRWTSYKDGGVEANPSVQYDFKSPVAFKGFRIWWYDDNGGVRLPDDFTFSVYNSETDNYEEVNIANNDAVSVSNEDKYKVYNFDKTYEGNEIRLTMFNEQSAHAAGIVEWELIDAEPEPVPPSPDPDPQPENINANLQTGDYLWIILASVAVLAAAAAIVWKREKLIAIIKK